MVNTQEFRSPWHPEGDPSQVRIAIVGIHTDTHEHPVSFYFSVFTLPCVSKPCYSSWSFYLILYWRLASIRRNKTKQTKIPSWESGISVSMPKSWMALGKQEGTICAPVSALSWCWWYLPHELMVNIRWKLFDCMILTQFPVELEAKSRDGSNDFISKEDLRLNKLHFQAWNKEHSQSLSLPELFFFFFFFFFVAKSALKF